MSKGNALDGPLPMLVGELGQAANTRDHCPEGSCLVNMVRRLRTMTQEAHRLIDLSCVRHLQGIAKSFFGVDTEMSMANKMFSLVQASCPRLAVGRMRV